MSTTASASSISKAQSPPEFPSLRWRSWPIVESAPRSSWVPLGVLVVGAIAGYVAADWRWGATAVGFLLVALWRFFVPVTYEIGPSGLIQETWWQRRRIAWSSVRSYVVRPTGVALFDRPAPTGLDTIRSIFLPYPDDPDDLVCALRVYLEHAAELATER